MANKTFNTRISLKYDTYANWTSKNPVLLKGETAIVVVPASTGAVTQEPTVLLKVGDGTSNFNDLSFVGAVAADVHSWAKAANKPAYSASEISGLADYISGQIEDTDTQYTIQQDTSNGHILKLMSRPKSGGSWSEVVSITTVDTVYDDTTVKGDISSLKTLVGNTAVATQIATAINGLESVYAKKATTLAGYGITDAYTKNETTAEISKAVAAADHLRREIVTSLPQASAANENTIYMVKDSTVKTGDVYKEYMLIDGAIVQVGDTSVDLTPYAKTADMTSAIATAKSEAASDATTKANTAEQNAKTYADGIKSELNTEIGKKANASSLATVATSGKIDDLSQTDYIVLDCGNASTNV